MRQKIRFSNDLEEFERVFSLFCKSIEYTDFLGWVHRMFRGLVARWGRWGAWVMGGQKHRALVWAVKFAQKGWVYVAPNDVWRFDTGGGKRILGIAGEVGKEARALILSKGEKGAEMAFREMGNGVGVLRVPEGEAGNEVLASVLAVAKPFRF